MSAKNLLDNTTTSRPEIFSDLTGKSTVATRLDLAATLLFLHEAHTAMIAANPKVEALSVRFAVGAICYHMGWHPYEISAAEQYIAEQGTTVDLSAG